MRDYAPAAILVFAATLMAGEANIAAAPSELEQDRIAFDSAQGDFEKIFPVTEKLNQILAEICKREIEQGRSIPNFLVYPYDPDLPSVEPFTLLWNNGEYVKRTKLPPQHQAILIYDPRRLTAGDEEIEEGKRVEYRHFIMRYSFNNEPDPESSEPKLTSPLEPTDSSIYISRAILGEGKRASEGQPTHQQIYFPRISIPKEFEGEDVRLIALQFESALHYGRVSETESEGGTAPDETVETSEQSFFLID